MQIMKHFLGLLLVDHADCNPDVDEDVITDFGFRRAREADGFDDAIETHATGAQEWVFTLNVENSTRDGEAHDELRIGDFGLRIDSMTWPSGQLYRCEIPQRRERLPGGDVAVVRREFAVSEHVEPLRA